MSRRITSSCCAAFALALCETAVPGAEARYTITDLGSLGGTFSGASSINNRGEILGTAHIGGPEANRHLFVWHNGVMTDIGSPGEWG